MPVGAVPDVRRVAPAFAPLSSGGAPTLCLCKCAKPTELQHFACLTKLVMTAWYWSNMPGQRNLLKSLLVRDSRFFHSCMPDHRSLARWPVSLSAPDDEILEEKTSGEGVLTRRSVKSVVRTMVDDPLLCPHLRILPYMGDHETHTALEETAADGFETSTFWWTDPLCFCVCHPCALAKAAFLWTGDVVRFHADGAAFDVDVAHVCRFAERRGGEIVVELCRSSGACIWVSLHLVLEVYSVYDACPADVALRPREHARRKASGGRPCISLPVHISTDEVGARCRLATS